MRKVLLLLTMLLLVGCTAPGLPSVTGTPSAPTESSADACHVNGVVYCVLNPAVTQATIHSTICVKGWTKTIRPDISITEPLKTQQLHDFASQHPNDPNWTLRGTEEDHRMPLEGGGHPSDHNNLSPQEHQGLMGSTAKDADENAYNKSVCNGSVTLAAAQAAFVAKWLAPYPGYKS